jgi:hypothetical protein
METYQCEHCGERFLSEEARKGHQVAHTTYEDHGD